MGKKSRSKRNQDAQSGPNDGTNQVPQTQQPTIEATAPATAHNQKGEYYEYYPIENKINIYQIVDSWRSYRNDATNLQSLNTLSDTPAFNPAAASFVPGQSASATTCQPRFTPYQPLRSVQIHARYPKYRVDKTYRISNGERERQVLHQARLQFSGTGTQSTLTHGGGRYALRNKREMSTSTNTPADKPLPSIELTDATWDQFGGRPINDVVRKVVQSKPRSRTSRTPTPCPVPKPTREYLTQAGLEPYHLTQDTQKLLVVLDLNGTLLYRKNRAHSANVNMRPGLTSLLKYLFENHTVMVYTSARPENAITMVAQIMSPVQQRQLVAIWARDKLDLTKSQYNSKVQVYKKLEKIWQEPGIQETAEEGRPWNQTNTILVDDSHLKASSQPYNLLQVPEFTNNKPQGDLNAEDAWVSAQSAILRDLQRDLEQLKWQGDVSRLIRQWQIGGRNQPATSEEHETMQAQKQDNADAQAEQLLTPKSPIIISSDSESDVPSYPAVEERSVSPIDESVWSSLLAGDGESKADASADADGGVHLPPSPASMGRSCE